MHDFTNFPSANFTKFEHNTYIGVATRDKSFWNTILEIAREGHFSKKCKIFAKIFDVFRLQAAVTPQ